LTTPWPITNLRSVLNCRMPFETLEWFTPSQLRLLA
jgi:hypothetical protein